MLLKSPDTYFTIPVHAVEITQNNRIFGTFPKISKNCAEMSRVKNDFNPRLFCWNFQSRQNSYEKAHYNFLKGSTTLLPPLMSANILRLTCNDNVRPNYFFLQFLRARISSSCFLQSETVFLAMVWGHAMHSLELAAAAPRLEQSVCWVYSCLFSWPEALPGLGKRH